MLCIYLKMYKILLLDYIDVNANMSIWKNNWLSDTTVDKQVMPETDVANVNML